MYSYKRIEESQLYLSDSIITDENELKSVDRFHYIDLIFGFSMFVGSDSEMETGTK